MLRLVFIVLVCVTATHGHTITPSSDEYPPSWMEGYSMSSLGVDEGPIVFKGEGWGDPDDSIGDDVSRNVCRWMYVYICMYVCMYVCT